MIARRIATAVAALLAVAGLGACGSAPVSSRRTDAAALSPAPAFVPAVRPASAATRTAAVAVRNVPAAFKLPPGSRVADLDDRESGASFTLTEPAPEAVLSFYRTLLPSGSFTVVADNAGTLSFRDPSGWAGTIYATTHRTTVAVKRA